MILLYDFPELQRQHVVIHTCQPFMKCVCIISTQNHISFYHLPHVSVLIVCAVLKPSLCILTDVSSDGMLTFQPFTRIFIL